MSGFRMRHEVELLELANADPKAALDLLSKLAGKGIRIDAAIALAVGTRCFEADPPPKPKARPGRPPLGFDERINRLWDGKAELEGAQPSRQRGERDLRRCVKEYQAFAANLSPDDPCE